MQKEKEFYAFSIYLEGRALKVGGDIYSPNGRKGEVVEINSIETLSNGEVEIKGLAAL